MRGTSRFLSPYTKKARLTVIELEMRANAVKVRMFAYATNGDKHLDTLGRNASHASVYYF